MVQWQRIYLPSRRSGFDPILVRSLGWEDPLETETATHSSVLAWRIPWPEECGRLQSMRLKKNRTQLSYQPAATVCAHVKFMDIFFQSRKSMWPDLMKKVAVLKSGDRTLSRQQPFLWIVCFGPETWTSRHHEAGAFI